MKKSLYGIVFFTSIILTACAQSRNNQQSYYEESSNPISYQQFYDDLSPYGQWLNDPELGYVWRPGEAGFRPYYSNGNWAYTNYGWTWVSDYNWGWAPFHYGRWFYDNFNGWLWVPGYDWAPAWVSWRGNSQYYGWAPLCPERRNGRNYQIQNDQWLFVPQQYITQKNVNNYYVNSQNNVTIINNTTVLNKTHVTRSLTKYPEGPNVLEVEKATNTKINPLQVARSTTPGAPQLQNGALHIYKPAVNTTISGKSRPEKIADIKNVSSGDLQPASRPQGNNNETRIISPEDRVTKKPIEKTLNNSSLPATGNEVRVPVRNPSINNPAVNNDNPVINSAPKVRQLSTEESQPATIRQVPVETRPVNSNNQVRQPQVNRLDNNTQEKMPAAPRQNLPVNNNQERRAINNQNQNPAFNQRQVREQQAPVFQRPPSNSFEKREQSVPGNTTLPHK